MKSGSIVCLILAGIHKNLALNNYDDNNSNDNGGSTCSHTYSLFYNLSKNKIQKHLMIRYIANCVQSLHVNTCFIIIILLPQKKHVCLSFV